MHRRVGAQLADELAAETFAVAFSRRGGFDPRHADARPWLYGIAANLLRNHRRSERRQLLAYARTGVDPVEPDAFSGADDRLDAARAMRGLAEALASLRDQEREVLLLFAWAELSYEEIAQALVIPVGTVRSRLSRARKRLAMEPARASGQQREETAILEVNDERS